MNLSFHIAKRYFLFGRKLNFINVITMVTIIIVTVVTMALCVSLSVFNGMEDLIRNIFQTFDSEIKISPAQSKTFLADSAFISKVRNTNGVAVITEVLEDDAFLMYDENRDVVKIKGVSDNFTKHHNMDSLMVAGEFKLSEYDTSIQAIRNYAVIGYGIQSKLNLSLNNNFKPIQVYYPNRKKIKNADPRSAFNIQSITASGFFAIEKRYDDSYLFVPLEFAAELMNYGKERTSLEIKVKDGYDIDEVRDELKAALGKNFRVQNSDEQHAHLLRAVRIEKIFIQIILSCIYGLASVIIFFCLSLLAINKKRDVAVLLSMGATPLFIRKLFITEGIIIAFTGVIAGVIGGVIICILQEYYGIVSMGMATSLVDAYPVRIRTTDILMIALTVFFITIIASLRPAISAASIKIRENL